MKVLVAVALFAFVAVQLSHAAPTPSDDKKEEPAASSAAPVRAAADKVAEKETAPSDPAREAKSAPSVAQPPPPPVPVSSAPAVPAPAEEKKD